MDLLLLALVVYVGGIVVLVAAMSYFSWRADRRERRALPPDFVEYWREFLS